MPTPLEAVKFDIEEFSDEIFNVEQSIAEAKEIMDTLIKEKRWVKGKFEDDYWEITKIHYSENHNSFNFNNLNKSLFNNHLPDDFKDVVKCWTIYLISKYKTSAITYLILFTKAFEITQGFRRKEIDALLTFIENSEYSNKYKSDMIISICNFFDYSDIEIGEDYIPSLIELKNKIPEQKNIRQLPSSKYVLSFSYYLEKHFTQLLNQFIKHGEINKELLLIYPLIIWWKLTNIIPMRPSEFCLLKRDATFKSDEKHYIKLPRHKLKNPKRIQIPDKLLIDEELYQLIESYVKLTEQYGRTDTLISFRSIIKGNPSTNRAVVSKNLNQFKLSNLDSLIKDFYKTMNNTYNCEILKENYIRPGDTRHFAFISLMMQGYSPVEIARLGGHQTIRAQYHYSAHQEYWVDCEVFELMKKIKNSKKAVKHTETIPTEVKLKPYEKQQPYRKKMKIGYCTDEEQKCETKLCYFCSHWGIDPDEYIEKKEKIRSDIIAMKTNINELISAIQNLNKQFLQDELTRRNSELLTNIKTKSNAVQSDIYKLALLASKLGGGEVLDGEKISWSQQKTH